MSKFLVAAPDGQSVTISSGYGTVTLRHMQEVSNSKLAAMFPHLFIQIQGDEPDPIVSAVPEKIEEPPTITSEFLGIEGVKGYPGLSGISGYSAESPEIEIPAEFVDADKISDEEAKLLPLAVEPCPEPCPEPPPVEKPQRRKTKEKIK